jgi:hypothetical protein
MPPAKRAAAKPKTTAKAAPAAARSAPKPAAKAASASTRRAAATAPKAATAKPAARKPAARKAAAPKATAAKPASRPTEAALDAAAQRLRKLNERIIEAGRQTGETTLSSYEKALKAIAGAVERGPGSSDIDWISHLATTQAKFIRDVTEAWTSTARGMLK